MIRTQIQLEPAQYERLKALATQRSMSIAQLVRQGVDHVLTHAQTDAAWDRFLGAAGTFRAERGEADVSARHDAYLEDAFR